MEKTKEITDYLNYLKKVQVLKYAKEQGKNKEAYEFFGIKRAPFISGKKNMKNRVKKVY
ncbi:hypothetical protein [Chryseobacterium sp. OV279]|uniref:hypothetical protein n=1 Tax=Chryseobacterium sp. OV279 TaxID=1500285 RepID=UPI00091627A0|nr:hypothetical protein SAMN02787100_2682 [Chryseobacterium sp. OV279]